MKKTMFLAALLSGAASAQMLGSESSFLDTNFCKQYGCEFLAKDLLGANVSAYHYRVGRVPAGYNPYLGPDPTLDFVVRRLNGKVISGGFEYGAQDSAMTAYNDGVSMYSAFISSMTGVAPDLAALQKFENTCGMSETGGQPKVTPWAKSYGVGCVNYLMGNARRLHYNIFKL